MNKSKDNRTAHRNVRYCTTVQLVIFLPFCCSKKVCNIPTVSPRRTRKEQRDLLSTCKGGTKNQSTLATKFCAANTTPGNKTADIKQKRKIFFHKKREEDENQVHLLRKAQHACEDSNTFLRKLAPSVRARQHAAALM